MKRLFGLNQRILAVVLAFVLVVTSFQGMSLTVYAEEDIITEEIVTEEENVPGEEETPVEGTTTVEETLIETSTEEEETPIETSTEEEETPIETSTEEEETPIETSTEEEETPIETSTEEEETPIETSPEEETSIEETETTEEETVEDEFPIESPETMEETENAEETEIFSTEATSGYNGTVTTEDGRTVLRIAQWEYDELVADSDEEMPEFSDTMIVDILKARTEAGENYEIVEVDRSSVTDSISKDVWNAVVGILKSDETTNARFSFAGSNSADENWSFDNPKNTDTVINTALTMTPGEAGKGVTVSFGSTDFPATDVWVDFYTDKWLNEGVWYERSDYTSIIEAFGEADTRLAVVNSNGEEVENVSGNFWMQTNEDGSQSAGFDIGNIKELTAGTDYTEKKAVYKGDIYTWEDENGEGVGLNINFDGADKGNAAFTEQELLDILAMREETAFDEIFIEQPDSVNTIYKSVTDKAASLLKSATDSRSVQITYAFRNTDSGFVKQWNLMNPGTAQSSDQTVTATNVLDEKGLKLEVGSQSLEAENVGISFIRPLENYSEEIEKIKKEVFQTEENSFEIAVADTDVHGWFTINDENAFININTINELTAGQTYYIEKQVYRGNVNEEDGSIYISPDGLGKEQFEAGDLESIVQYYVDKGITFNAVMIEQKNTASKTIKKDVINLTRQLLSKEEAEKRLTFVFCGCGQGEDEKWYQNDFNFNLINPGEATKDINANVVLTTPANKGITMKLNANTYNADNVFVTYYVSSQTSLGRAFVASLGEPEGDGGNTELFVLKKSAEVEADFGGDYRKNEEDKIELNVGALQNWTPATNYQLVKSNWFSKPITTKEIPAEFAELVKAGATSCVWKSCDTDVATISSTGVITPINAGMVHFSVSYKIGAASYFKVYRGFVERPLEKISFDKSTIKMELPPEGEDWEVNDYIDVNYYPSNASIDRDPAMLKWTSSNESVVKLVPFEGREGVYNGEIVAVGEGTAKIKAVYPGDESIYAECTVTVEKAFTVPEEAWQDVYAVTNFAKTLKDVKLPKDPNGKWSWKWKNEATSLTPFVGMDGYRFWATFTMNGRTRDFLMYVRMVTITGMDIVAVDKDMPESMMEVPVLLEDGNTVLLNYTIDIQNGNRSDLKDYFGDGKRLKINWTSNPKNIGKEKDIEGWENSYEFTADKKSAGKKTFTVSIVDTQNNNKAIAKDSVSVTVVKGAVINFDDMVVDGLDELYVGEVGDKSTLTFTVPKENYYNLTIKSSDASVVKLGRVSVTGDDFKTVTVPYEIKKAGATQITVTASDEAKSTTVYNIMIIDREPKLIESSFTINKVYEKRVAPMTISFTDGYGKAAIKVVPVSSKAKDVANAAKFTYQENTYENGKSKGYITLNDSKLKNGTYKINLQVMVDVTQDGIDGVTTKEFTIPVSVKVVDKAPSVTLKQTKKVNTFYKSATYNHYGLLTVNTGSNELTNVSVNSDADFTLERVEDTNTFIINLKPNAGTITKKVTLTYTLLDDEKGVYKATKSFNVATENKAPSIAVMPSSETLYPNQGNTGTDIRVVNKKTMEIVDLNKVHWVVNKNKKDIREIKEQPENAVTASLKKNTFTLTRHLENTININVDTRKAGTDKIVLQVQQSDWSKPLNVTYSVKVDVKVPKLKLSASKLTLNKNDAVYATQTDYTLISFAGSSTPFEGRVQFTGKDAKSAAILNDKLVLEYWGDGKIVARLNTTELTNKTLTKGTYKYTVWAQGEDSQYKASTTLTINIVDVDSKQSMKVSKKGSIDVLRRDTTYITYVPKAKNLTGEVVNGYLTGQDAEMFDAYYEYGTGLVVKAREGERYTTKNTYKVQPVFIMETFDGGKYEVTAAVQSFKVTQGKPKVTVTPEGSNVLYRQAGNNLNLNFNAVLKNEDIAIKDVTLLNYTDDLKISYQYNNGENRIESPISISQYNMKDITTTGKKWTLKFAVTYTDKAGNEKSATVSYKVIIK